MHETSDGRHGSVRVRVLEDPDPTIIVEDNGIGIDPRDVPRLFLPFQSGRANGTGLGLALTRKIILMHGGSVQMTGAPGKGARVTVRLPSRPGLFEESRT